jgi:DNA-binding NtrC family response regulator
MSLARILIVDDDLSMQELLQAWLHKAGYETLMAGDGEQGLTILSQSPFDLILVDYQMPKMDGLGVLGKIAEHNVPVGPLLLTASRSVGLIVEAMRRGALDCVLKPSPQKSFLATLDEALERHWARQLDLSPLSHWRDQTRWQIGEAERGSLLVSSPEAGDPLYPVQS